MQCELHSETLSQKTNRKQASLVLWNPGSPDRERAWTRLIHPLGDNGSPSVSSKCMYFMAAQRPFLHCRLSLAINNVTT
jgi:hypothetical protein